MWLEVVAAVLVGVSLLWLVFEPVLAPPQAKRPDPLALDELLDEAESRSGTALGALKEIEFDRETGKLSDADYVFLKTKYTAEALTALRADAADEDTQLEAEVSARVSVLRADGLKSSVCAGCGTRAEPDAQFCAECGASLNTPARCGACGGEISAGGRFCASCGGRVAA